MKININLISPTTKEIVREERTIKILKISAIATLALVGIAAVVVFLITSQLSPASVKKREEGVLKSISTLKGKEGKLILINQKLEDIENIIEKRPKYDLVMESIVNTIPSEASINTFNIDREKISLVVSSESLLSIEESLNGLITLVKEKKIIESLTIENFTADSRNGFYSVSITGKRL